MGLAHRTSVVFNGHSCNSHHKECDDFSCHAHSKLLTSYILTSLAGQTFMGTHVGDTNQIAEFAIITFTFRIGHMNSIFQTRMRGDLRAACP